MAFRWNAREHLALGVYLAKWFVLAAPLGGLIGSACALFLWSLDCVTAARFAHPALLFALPLAGAAMAWMYERFGGASAGGNNLLMDAINESEDGSPSKSDNSPLVPRRMAPLILLATLGTHLFGGSAGREGTAVQMGGSIASTFGRALKLNSSDLRILLMAGVAGGFGGVFGTPLAGAIFALEVLAIGRLSYDALIPCLACALIADATCHAWGIRHEAPVISAAWQNLGTPIGVWLAFKIVLAALLFGLVSVVFAELTHGVDHVCKRFIASPLLRPVVGGIGVIGLTLLLGTRDFLGLGVSSPNPHAVTIGSAFLPGGANDWSWWWKLFFTALTLGSGFKGGEVTPLFFIGATLGNVLGRLLGAPVDLFAGLGFVAVFAGATNTPLACTLMGIELFGSGAALPMTLACFVAYIASGHSGIYSAQRIGTPKLSGLSIEAGATLASLRNNSKEKSS